MNGQTTTCTACDGRGVTASEIVCRACVGLGFYFVISVPRHRAVSVDLDVMRRELDPTYPGIHPKRPG